MGSYIIKATNLVPETGTIIADAGFGYSDNLNEINEAEIKISATGSVKRSLLVIGSEIEISRNETVEFLGIIDNINYLIAGTVTFHVSGYEWRLAKENGDYANSPWQSTASATIFGAIIAESNYLTAGTINAGFNIDFRLSTSQSLWNGLANLAKKTTQDIQVDYPNKEIDILNHRGSSTSVGTYNENINITNVRVNLGYPLGNHILVFGKGDGANQITGSAEDAASIATYGRIKRTVTDRSIVSATEADKLADAELALTKDPPKIIDFDFVNPGESVKTGDIITLNAEELSNEEVRIVGLERGIKYGKEFLTAQVTNPAFKTLLKRRNKILSRLVKDQIDQTTYMQGATNIWGDTQLGNADASNPLILRLYVPPDVDDEVGNTRINDVKLSYTLKDYKTFSGTLSGATGNAFTTASMTNASSLTGAGINNVSSTTGAGITNAKQGSGDVDYDFGPYTDSSWTKNTSWQSVASGINTGSGSYLFHAGWCVVRNSHDSGSTHEGVWMRIYNSTLGTYFPNSSGVQIMKAMYVSQTVPSSAYGLIIVPLHWSSDTYRIQIKKDVGTDVSVTVEYGYFGIQGHTHSNTFNDASHTNNNTFSDANHTNNNTFNDAQHTNPFGTLSADYALGETATGANDTSIKIYNSNNDLLWDSGARGAIEETNIDISSYITANDWYRIEIYPNNDALVYGTVYVKGGVDS